MKEQGVVEIVWMVLHYIGSATPLAILCFMLAFISGGKKVKMKTVGSYIVVAVIMFVILLRT